VLETNPFCHCFLPLTLRGVFSVGTAISWHFKHQSDNGGNRAVHHWLFERSSYLFDPNPFLIQNIRPDLAAHVPPIIPGRRPRARGDPYAAALQYPHNCFYPSFGGALSSCHSGAMRQHRARNPFRHTLYADEWIPGLRASRRIPE
jgi:hypothetical protein